MQNVRNFCIIAHIDHGKSTLSDRFLEVTGTVSKRELTNQMTDQMDLERERGITIKLQPARMQWKARNGVEYTINLIDTPGHVDFTYEVSRSLAAVEGAVLLVDATQGVQAQTIGNLYLALEQNLTIIPVINKIDLPNAQPERCRDEIVHLLGCSPNEVLYASGKTGEGVPEILEQIVTRVPAPKGDAAAPLRALVFDSFYDSYKGVIAFVRIVDGAIKKGQKFMLSATLASGEALEVGCFYPKMRPMDAGLVAGDIGYIVTGFKDISGCRVGDTVTVTDWRERAVQPLPGYHTVNPMVFAGIFPKEGDDFEHLREAMGKLKLSDSSLVFEPEQSAALGLGFRTGLLGLLHLEIVQERLRREYGIEVVVTSPSVAYHVKKTNGEEMVVRSPLELPDPSHIKSIEEPWMKVDIIAPKEYIGAVMGMVSERRGIYRNTEYLAGTSLAEGGAVGERALLHYEVPLAILLVDFYDTLKSVTSGYASLSYDYSDYREADVVRLDILVAEEPADALATITYRDTAERVGRRIVAKLKDTLDREQFEIKLQAAIGGKVVASERIAPFRKDVTGYLSGGDWTRKMKLLEKQKKGKKRMQGSGRVDIPPEAYLAVLKRD